MFLSFSLLFVRTQLTIFHIIRGIRNSSNGTTFCSQPPHCGQELIKETLPSSGCELLVAGIHSRAVCTGSLELQRERYPSALLLLLCVLFCILDLKDQQLNDLHSRAASEWFQSLLCKYQPDAVFILALHREFSTLFLCFYYRRGC